MNSSSKKSKKILLLDNTKKILENIQSEKFDRIIVFDLNTSKTLEKLKIKHILSESFLEENDFNEIQKKSYEFSEWFLIKEISKNIFYENVNLGSLSYIELYVFLIPILKKIREIQKIIKEFPDCLFVSSKSLKIILSNFKIISEEFEDESNDESFFYDKINVENKYFKFLIPRKYYFQIKNLNDKFMSYLITNKIQSDTNVFLIEFDTIRYKSLIENFSKKNILTGYFGIRRPPIWNFRSFSIIKNSNVYIANHFDFNKNVFDETLLKTKKSLEEIFNDDNFSKNFQFFNELVGDIIKPIIQKLFFRRLSEFIKNIDFAKQNLTKYSPKCIMVLSESGATEQIVIQLAKKLNIPVILLQHGLFNDNPDAHVYNQFSGAVLKNCDEFFVWGNALQKYAERYNLEKNRVHVLGSTIHDSFFDLNSKKNEHLLIISQGPAIKLHVKDYTKNANKSYEKIIKGICEIAKIQNKKLVIKLHPHEKDNNEENISKKIYSNVKVIKKGGDATNLIKSCSAVISLGTSISTAILEAHILKKPVIRIPYGDWFGQPDYLQKPSGLYADINELDKILLRLEKDHEFYQSVLNIGESFLEDCLKFPKTASIQMSQFISKNF